MPCGFYGHVSLVHYGFNFLHVRHVFINTGEDTNGDKNNLTEDRGIWNKKSSLLHKTRLSRDVVMLTTYFSIPFVSSTELRMRLSLDAVVLLIHLWVIDLLMKDTERLIPRKAARKQINDLMHPHVRV